jgi:serine/threonine protein phosphatase PrpC
MKNTENLLSLMDVFAVKGEMVAGKGEDNYAIKSNVRYGLFGVFDGCGGIGSRKYPVFQNRTGAFIAAQIAGRTIKEEWFPDFCNKGQSLSANNIPVLLNDLKGFLLKGLADADSHTEKSLIKGSLTKNFPTTAAFVLSELQDGDLKAYFIWAGDSRGYLLGEYGLVQVTADDISGGMDAMSNLNDDGKLTNVISADGDFNLNYTGFTIQEQTILITATDGCFGYFQTPMEFEFMLLETLCKSKNIAEWKNAVDRQIREVAGDDYTICIAVYKSKGFKELKKAYARRYEHLRDEYIKPMKTADAATLTALWDRYKNAYYGGGGKQ